MSKLAHENIGKVLKLLEDLRTLNVNALEMVVKMMRLGINAMPNGALRTTSTLAVRDLALVASFAKVAQEYDLTDEQIKLIVDSSKEWLPTIDEQVGEALGKVKTQELKTALKDCKP